MPLNQAPRPRRFKLAFRRRFPTYRLPLEPTAPVISILQTSPEHSPTDCQGRIRFEPGLNADGKTALIMGTGVAAINTNADAREQQTPPGLMKSSASSHSIGSSVDQLLTPNASCDPFDSDAEIDNALSDEDEDETSTPSPSPTRNRGIGKGKTAFYLAAGTDASLPSSPPSLPPPPTLVPLTGDDMDVPIATFELFPMPPYEWTGGQVWPKYEGEDGSVVTLNVRKWSAARESALPLASGRLSRVQRVWVR